MSGERRTELRSVASVDAVTQDAGVPEVAHQAAHIAGRRRDVGCVDTLRYDDGIVLKFKTAFRYRVKSSGYRSNRAGDYEGNGRTARGNRSPDCRNSADNTAYTADDIVDYLGCLM